ncbi:MAG TPA: hypothetical protein VFD84_09990 [Candidatus Binatia bacterium]|jgi:hypothetical protein|nr:hypothetical protein [Candidatus Binatia bacterium]
MNAGQAGGPSERPDATEVLHALREAASQLGSFVSHMMREQPGVALIGALAAGFVTGGGLVSPVGARLTASTLRATLGNVATLVALDLVRRAVEGDSIGGTQGTGTT